MTPPTPAATGGVPPLSQVDYWQARAAANLATLCDRFARPTGLPWAHWDDVWAADPGSPVVILNAATLLRPLPEARTDEVIRRVTQFYAEQPGPPWAVWSAWPAPALQPQGFTLVLHMPLMVWLPGGPLPSAPSSLRIREAADAPAIADFERVVIDGYPIAELQPAWIGTLLDSRMVSEQLRLWVGYLGDRPVTAVAGLADDVVNGIYFVATLPEVRGQGYGTAVTTHAVRASAGLPAVLQASDLGCPIYQRLGFRTVAHYDVWVKPR